MTATTGGGEEVHFVDPVDKYSVFIVRGTIIGTGLLGLALFVKNSKLFAKFEHVNQIPKNFIAKEIKLRGTVRDVTPTGYLRVEHRPKIRLPRLLTGGNSKKPVGLLNLKLAGLDISQAGLSYVSRDLRLTNKSVFFTVVKPTADNSDAVDADVDYKKIAFGRTNLNIDLVRRGYARVFAPHDPIHLKALQHNGAYSRLITRLLTSEMVADRRGVGVWEREGWVESISSLPSATGQIVRANPVTKLLILTYNVLLDFAAVGFILAKQGYYTGVAIVQYAAVGYRKLTRFVDRLSRLYFSTKSGGSKAIEKK